MENIVSFQTVDGMKKNLIITYQILISLISLFLEYIGDTLDIETLRILGDRLFEYQLKFDGRL